MTAPDWPSLAARFEAATDDDIYECVRELVEGATHASRGRLLNAIYMASVARIPDLLLGVVVACVPEGTDYDIGRVDGESMGYAFRSVTAEEAERWGENTSDGSVMISGRNVANIAAGALGAAVCRAWSEVEREKGEAA